MKYIPAPDLQQRADEISKVLFPHVDILRVKCFRSSGSSSRGTIARCHALGKLMQKALDVKAHYALEFISERFDKMSKDEQDKVIIHELMHIPFAFGGGFKHHDWVCDKNVNMMYKKFKSSQPSSQLICQPQIIQPEIIVPLPTKKLSEPESKFLKKFKSIFEKNDKLTRYSK